jgi:uncharacterized tellurite resistance protein B-like protein
LIAYIERGLDPYEDHLVWKIAHPLYVPPVKRTRACDHARSAWVESLSQR